MIVVAGRDISEDTMRRIAGQRQPTHEDIVQERCEYQERIQYGEDDDDAEVS